MLDRAVARALPLVPRRLVAGVAARYIAGETREDALRCIRALNEQGASATVDLLGEMTRSGEEAEAVAGEYGEVLGAIAAAGLDANVSIKPTNFGISVDAELCRALVARLLARSAETGRLVRVEMEHPDAVDAILDLYERLRADHDNAGIVLQARLRRTPADLERLLPLVPDVRLVKGIYRSGREIDLDGDAEVRTAYVELARRLLDAGCRVAFATHDDRLVEACADLVAERDLAPAGYEFQMLLGVRERLRAGILADGHPMRVYVPYGARWYEYSLRRMQESPQVVGSVAIATAERALEEASRRVRRTPAEAGS